MRNLSMLLLFLFTIGCGSSESPAKNNDVVVIVDANNTSNVGNENNSNATNGASNTTGGTNSNDTPPPPTAEEFLQRTREIACDAAFNCPTSANRYLVQYTGRFGDIEGCLESREVTYARHFDIEGSVDAGTIVYNGDTAADCLREMQERLCDGTWGRAVGGIESCRNVLQPTLAEGQRCASSFECVDSFCDTRLTCGERVCTAFSPCGTERCLSGEYCDQAQMRCESRKPEGAACNFGQCDSFYACDAVEGGTCVPWGTLGQGAGCVIEQSCGVGLMCHPDDRICVPVTFGGTGADCGVRGGEHCEPGLSCRVPNGSDTGQCGEPLAQGASCRSTAGCADGLICDVWADDTCEPERPAGAVCQSGAQCASGSCPGGMGSSADGVCEAVCNL